METLQVLNFALHSEINYTQRQARQNKNNHSFLLLWCYTSIQIKYYVITLAIGKSIIANPIL